MVDGDHLKFAAVIALLAVLTGVAGGFQTPGTITLPQINPSALIGGGDGGSDIPRCTITAKISVKGELRGASLQGDTFRIADSHPTGLFSYSWAGTGQYSLLGASDVELKFILNGPSDTPSTTKQVADYIGWTGSETVEYSATNLRPGTYHLFMNLYHSKGSDSLEKVFTVNEQCGVVMQ
ncbi:MAG: hypothetical protein SVU32_03905 [Candidatus Nanohaloarchaea archaeon]|nr:hypothetical protein [Candidatus Nanohaloarchaea archaeon]